LGKIVDVNRTKERWHDEFSVGHEPPEKGGKEQKKLTDSQGKEI